MSLCSRQGTEEAPKCDTSGPAEMARERQEKGPLNVEGFLHFPTHRLGAAVGSYVSWKLETLRVLNEKCRPECASL